LAVFVGGHGAAEAGFLVESGDLGGRDDGTRAVEHDTTQAGGSGLGYKARNQCE
jgi:hypothetical protein